MNRMRCHSELLSITHGTRSDIVVKEKNKGKYRDYTTRLQGLPLFGLLRASRDLGIDPVDFVRGAIEKELVGLGYLPKWWYTRDKGVVLG